jgi:hypothetical protein
MVYMSLVAEALTNDNLNEVTAFGAHLNQSLWPSNRDVFSSWTTTTAD